MTYSYHSCNILRINCMLMLDSPLKEFIWC